MKARSVFLSSALIIALYGLVQAQYPEDKYPVKTGENVMRVVVSNRTQTPLSGLTLKFAESQPSWFTKEKEETFDVGAQSATLLELPFYLNSSSALTEAVTLQLLAQEKLLGSFAVNLSTDGALGKAAGGFSSTSSALEESLLEKAVEPAIPTESALHQNYPNPFNPSTTIQYDLPQAGRVVLEIFDPLGRVVKTLIKGESTAGVHTVTWNGTNDHGGLLPSGVYIYRIVSPGFVQTRKMLLVR
jgi:hypothetical protein